MTSPRIICPSLPFQNLTAVLAVVFFNLFCSGALAQAPAYPDYKPVRRVSGTIRVCGSPQLGQLLKRYQSGFISTQPMVHFETDLESTLTAVSGVSSGHADVGLLGREIWPAEEEAFIAAKGHPPLAIKIAMGSYDVPKATFALMVFVPRANPITSLSLDQLERIFAATDNPIRSWGELGLKGPWAKRPVRPYGFAKDNDKSRIFRQLVFNRGEPWSPTFKDFADAPGPEGADAGQLILQAVAGNPNAIGISNIHYATPAVKALALSRGAGLSPVLPTRDEVAAGVYPLTRAIYMVIDPASLSHHQAQSSAGSALVDFLQYVLSRQSRRAIIEEGNYLPLTPQMALHEEMSLRADLP